MQQLQLSIENAPLITEQEIDDIFQGKIVRKLNVPDLPPELWMDILSYLPRGFVRKMIGINRFLFELGMRELYEEVRLLDYDNFGLKTFEQIGHANIASRVQRLHVQPRFLPGMDRNGRAIYDKGQTRVELKTRKSQSSGFLATAFTSLTHCPHLRDLTVLIHDQYLPRSLAKFLRKLIKAVGEGLDALTIDMTLPSFLSIHHVFDPKCLSKLSSLTIRITNSRYETPARQARKTRKALLNLITPLKSTLRSLAFEVIDFNLSRLFQKLQNLPLLCSLELRAEVGFSTLIPTIHSMTFLQRNANNLERLVIRKPTIDIPNSWNLDAMIHRLYDLLCIQQLPRLRELVLEVDYPAILTSLISHVHTFAPHLRNLTLTGQCSALDDPQLTSLLHGLAGCDRGLEYLKISLTHFSPEHMDRLASSLPNLKRLDLTYQILSIDSNTPENNRNQKQDIVYDLFRGRVYPQWKLEELRLMQVNICAEGHPDARLLSAVAEGLSLKRIIRTRTCDCRW